MLSTDKQTDKQTDRQTNQRYQKHNLLCQGGKNRKLAQRHDVKINEQAIINSLNYNIRFYINHIAKL